MNDRYTLKKINEYAANPKEFLALCSQEYHKKADAAASEIFGDKSKKIVMLAGPSSSGKTTTAKILSEDIKALGGRAYTVSLDDFYHPHSVGYPLDENGKPDYECVEALDIELLHAKLGELAENGKSILPVFDFKTGERINNAKTIELRENDVIIVEGLHALNPVITDTLSEKNLYKIYVSVSSRVYNENGEVLLSKRDLRFIRRMVRDFSFRSTPVERTFEIWQSVTRGEDKYLFPFEDRADVKINSFHPCEPCVFAQRAINLLGDVEKEEYKEKAQRLINTLSLFEKTDYSLLPADSLLREFTG
ncbi:MAG: nucleoside kinase [Clostridia bacterium]|nr:nucleoside kinase [Clostridia bacterium]